MTDVVKPEPTPEGKDKLVAITVDNKPKEVRKGDWIVSALKAEVGVPPEKVLAKVTEHGLKDLADNEEIKVKEGEVFMSHARNGASS